MRRSTKWLLFGGTVGAAAGLAAGWGMLARPWHLRWGATDEEVGRPMPFDELVERPNFSSTRAITIEATPDEVWPFLNDLRMLPFGTAVRSVDEHRCIAFAPPEQEAEASWVVTLEPAGERMTRLVSRNRARFAGRAAAIARYLMIDPGQFAFERNWMLGIKARAEELAKALQVPATPAPQVEEAAEKVEV